MKMDFFYNFIQVIIMCLQSTEVIITSLLLEENDCNVKTKLKIKKIKQHLVLFESIF